MIKNTIIKDYQWLFIDLNSYFASIEQQLNPALRGKPVAVVPVLTDATCAIAASREAKAFGIKTGTKIYEAKRLCPNLNIILARHDHYVEYHHRILAELDRHIPIASVESIDEAACRLLGPQCTREGSLAVARQIKAGLKANIGECVTASIGIAPNKYLAKVATNLQKPDGLVVLEAANLPGPLLRLKLTDLPGIARGMSARLARAGIFTMEELWALPPKHLRHIWGGVGGERYWYALHGIHLEKEDTTRKSIGHSHVLEPQYRPPREAAMVGQRLLLKAASRLRRLDYMAQALDVGIRIENGPRYGVGTRFHHASDSPTIMAAFQPCWQELVREARGRPIKKISVTLSSLIPCNEVQPELFDSVESRQQTQRRDSLSKAMDKLNARYGRDTVVMGFLPRRSHAFSGTKIAFTRIPDREEFHE